MKTSNSETNNHILATNGVLKFILGAGELHFDVTYAADHPSLFLDVNGAMLSQDFTHFCNNGGRNVRKATK
jgi:hypothetical protein